MHSKSGKLFSDLLTDGISFQEKALGLGVRVRVPHFERYNDGSVNIAFHFQ